MGRNIGSVRVVFLLGLAGLLAGCRGIVGNGPTPVGEPQGIEKGHHIIFLAQENRGFEHYFGAMRQYWASNNFPDQRFDGLPQFNPTSGIAPLQGPAPSNQGCDLAMAPPNDCTINSNS